MAIAYDNFLTKNYYGRFGDAILKRWRGGKSILSKRPDCSKVVKSKAQKDNMKRFAAAIIYAKKVLLDPQKRDYYRKKKKKFQTTWNAAISDFMSRPRVEAIDFSAFSRLKGNIIRISAWDKFMIKAVNVEIYNSTNQVIESGPAAAKPYTGNREWEFEVQEMNQAIKGSMAVVSVFDLPGNKVQRRIVIPDST